MIPTAKPMVSTRISREDVNSLFIPCSDYANNEVKICYNTESLKVVTAGNTNIHAHAAITNILVVGQYSKDMSGAMT